MSASTRGPRRSTSLAGRAPNQGSPRPGRRAPGAPGRAPGRPVRGAPPAELAAHDLRALDQRGELLLDDPARRLPEAAVRVHPEPLRRAERPEPAGPPRPARAPPRPGRP